MVDHPLPSREDSPGLHSQVSIAQALRTRFLLLHQPTPNSFVIAGPPGSVGCAALGDRVTSTSSESSCALLSRYRVTIGPQLCTCTESVTAPTATRRPCAHILFVMLRVLRLGSTDNRILKNCLQNVEVELLLQNYAQLRAATLHVSTSGPNDPITSMADVRTSTSPPTVSSGRVEVPRIAIPRPVNPTGLSLASATASAFTAPMLAAVRAAVGSSSECSELSAITRGLTPYCGGQQRGAGTTSPRTTSSSAESGNRLVLFVQAARRPRTAPAPPGHEASVPLARLDRCLKYQSSATTFRPIADSSTSETEQEDGTSPSSRSSHVGSELVGEDAVGRNRSIFMRRAQTCSSGEQCFHFQNRRARQMPLSEEHEEETSLVAFPPPQSVILGKGAPDVFTTIRESVSEDLECPFFASIDLSALCMLCMQRLEDGAATRCTTNRAQVTGCRAAFHQSCFNLWRTEYDETDEAVYCPVCGRSWPQLPSAEDKSSDGDPRITGTLFIDEDPASVRLLNSEVCAEPSADNREVTSVCQHLSTNTEKCQSRSQSNAMALTDTDGLPLEHLPTEAFGQGAVGTENVAIRTMNTSSQDKEFELWKAAFTEEVANEIISSDWRLRQLGLRKAAKLTICRVLSSKQLHYPTVQGETILQSELASSGAVTQESGRAIPTSPSRSPTEARKCLGPDSLRMAFRLIQYLLDDPVDGIYVAALCAFREILGYLICLDKETQSALQRAIGLVLRRLLRFVGGHILPTAGASVAHGHGALQPRTQATERQLTVIIPTDQLKRQQMSVPSAASTRPSLEDDESPLPDPKRRANLALATLIELAKGQDGEMSIGRDTSNASECMPISGPQHLARFVLRSAKFHQTHLIGRLTLLEKLVQMHREATASAGGAVARDPGCGERQLAYRHLCSSLIFARRHVYPPEQPVFPHHYLMEGELRRRGASCWRNEGAQPTHQQEALAPEPNISRGPTQSAQPRIFYAGETVKISSSVSLMESHVKASRMARRLFISVAQALLLVEEGTDTRAPINLTDRQPVQRLLSMSSSASQSSQISRQGTAAVPPGNYPICARSFVESELTFLDVSLAARFRDKLGILLKAPAGPAFFASLVSSASTMGIPSTVLTANSHLPTSSYLHSSVSATVLGSQFDDHDHQSTEVTTQPLRPRNPSLVRVACLPTPKAPNSGQSLKVITAETDIRKTAIGKEHKPPLPPPRRCADLPPMSLAMRRNENHGKATTKPSMACILSSTRFVCAALEPAYDPVALSEAGTYTSASESEEETEEPLEKVDWKRGTLASMGIVPATAARQRKPFPTPLTGSEELAALQTSLRQSSRLPQPLPLVPHLPTLLNARQTFVVYVEGRDWVRGPILGRGAFSQCFQARDLLTGTLMAVKRIRLHRGSAFSGGGIGGKEDEDCGTTPDAGPRSGTVASGRLSVASIKQLAAVQAEVATMRRIRHPNVLRLFGVVYNPVRKMVDIFIEWMAGGSVTSLLDQYGAFSEPVSLAYGVQLIRGLICLHRYGILHRDLKGANLLVDNTGTVLRISDFGATAKLGSQGSVSGQFEGQVIGTFAFMAPEVLRGEAYGRACDIWSVGCCFLEMLTSKPPWNDSRLTNQYALMYAIATADYPPTYPTEISCGARAILDACFSRTPELRPTARNLLDFAAFRQLTDGCPVPPSIDSSLIDTPLLSAHRRHHHPAPPLPPTPSSQRSLQNALHSPSWTTSDRQQTAPIQPVRLRSSQPITRVS